MHLIPDNHQSVWTLRLHGVLFSLCQVLTELIVLQHLTQYAWKYKIKAVRAIFFSLKKDHFMAQKLKCVTCFTVTEINSREKSKASWCWALEISSPQAYRCPGAFRVLYFNLGALKCDKGMNHLKRPQGHLRVTTESGTTVFSCQHPWLKTALALRPDRNPSSPPRPPYTPLPTFFPERTLTSHTN